MSLKGNAHINGAIKTGLIRIGFSDVGIIDSRFTRTVIELNGLVVFKGKANFGIGSKICVGKNGTLQIGTNCFINVNTTIICFDQIILGNNVAISWETIIMDTDFHETQNTVTNEINKATKPILLGDNTWIGMKCTVLKGTQIPPNNIVGATVYSTKHIKLVKTI